MFKNFTTPIYIWNVFKWNDVNLLLNIYKFKTTNALTSNFIEIAFLHLLILGMLVFIRWEIVVNWLHSCFSAKFFVANGNLCFTCMSRIKDRDLKSEHNIYDVSINYGNHFEPCYCNHLRNMEGALTYAH